MFQELEQFKIWLQANSKANNTIDAYLINLLDFFKSAGICVVADITEQKINSYFASLKARVSQATVNQHISALKSFLDYKNIIIRVPKTKTPTRKEIEVITEDEFLNVIIPAVERDFTNPLRVKAFLYFLYYVGLRVQDAAKVKRSQFDFKNNALLVFIEKQNLQKNVILPVVIKDILETYFSSEAEETSAFNMTYFQIEGVFDKLRFVLPEMKLHPHKFRKSCATNADLWGMDIKEIQNMMGHKSILTTQIYVQKTDKQIREKYLRLEAERLKKLRKRKHEKN